MESTQATTVLAPPPPPKGLFGTKIPSAITFALGILLFLLPFAEIKCGGTTLVNKSGLDFAIGTNWKTVNNWGNDKGNNNSKDENKKEEGNAQYFAIAALALGALGLLLSFANAKTGGSGAVITGVLCAGALIGLMIDLKKWFDDSVAKDAMNKTNDAFKVNIGNDTPTLGFTPWFYITVIAFLAAAVFSYLRMRSSKTI